MKQFQIKNRLKGTLVAALCLSSLSAWAEDYDLWVGGVQVTSDNAENVLGDEETPTVAFDESTNTLTLNNLQLASDYVPAGVDASVPFITNGLASLTINLIGYNRLLGVGTYFLVKSGEGEDNTVTFTATDEQAPGSIEIYCSNQTPWYTGHTLVWGNGLGWSRGSDGDYGSCINISTESSSDYNLTVAGVGVNAENASSINGGYIASGTVMYDALTNKLTLTDAVLTEGIVCSNGVPLTIELYGTNSINVREEAEEGSAISYYGNSSCTLIIKKADDAESCSLALNSSSNDWSVISGFYSATWDGLNIQAELGVTYSEDGQKLVYLNDDNAESVTFTTGTPTYPLIVAGVAVTSDNADNIFADDQTNDGKVSYDFDTSTLTLDGASLYTNENNPSPMIISQGALNVLLKGDSYIGFNGSYSSYAFRNTGTSGALTISAYDSESSLGMTSEYYEGDYKGLCEGFSQVNFNNDLGLFNRSGSKAIETITGHAPSFYIDNGTSSWTTGNGLLLNATYHYKIDYVDDTIEGSGVEVGLATDETSYGFSSPAITISELAGPCTITAYTKVNGTVTGSNKAKLFNSNPSPFRIVATADPVDLVLVPAIEESDGISITGIEANVTYNTVSGKISSSTLGSFGGPVAMSATEGKTAILNNYFTMDFEVVPPAPSVSLEAGSYLNTDNESITITGTGQANTTVKYKWDDGEAQTYTEAISVLTGTLKAWEEYAESGTTVTSDTTAVEYTVNTNIATLYVAPIADIAYTSSAVTPTVVVKETEDAEASLVAGTDYTISGYKQGETAVAAADLINVGTYTVVIAGTGSYGGTKEASFDIVQADITPVVSITGWDYGSYDATENAPSVTSNPGSGAVTYQYKVKDADDETYVAWPESPNTIAAGTYTIKATVAATTNYNSGTGTKDFIIAKATPTITFAEESYSVTYGEDFVSPGSVGDWPVTPTASSNTSVATVSEGNITIVGVGTTTITVTYAGNDNYNSTTATYPLVVNAKDISGYQVTVDATQTYTYTGSAITPNVTVAPASGGDALVLDTDYTIEYTNNTNAATSDDTNAPTATVTGKGNYIGTASAKFNIGKADLAGVTIAAIDNQTYTGDSIKPGVTVTFNDKAVAATEYDIAYTNNVNVSSETSATVTLTAKGVNFTEGSTKTASFQIVAATATITAVASQETTYNGESQAVTATVDKGTAVITYFTSEANRTSNTEGTTDAPTNAGTYYVKVTQGNANYTSTAVDVTFTINPKTLTDDMVTLSAESFPYNGETQKPTVTVSDGTAMTADDYTVTNNGGQAVGTYDVVVTGKGNYTGEVTRSFSIVNRTLEVGANGDVQFAAGQTWASFYTTTESLELPEGVMAYIVTAVSETSATLQAINYVPQNVPVFLENGSTETTDNASADGNLLQGTTAATAVSTISGTVYGLHNNKLMQVTSGSIPAGRAYLTVDVPAGGRELTMIKESDTTGIETLGVADVDSNNLWYDMAGRKLQSKPNKKGFYIQNGKKVFVNK